MVDYQTRQKLNALSKEVFGSSSRWQKLVNTGHLELLTQEVNETVPSDVEGGEPTVQKVNKPILTKTGAQQKVNKRYTVESVVELMLDIKKKREEYLEKMKSLQAEAKAAQAKAELIKQIHADAAGSAGLG